MLVTHTECLEKELKSGQAVTSKPTVLLICGQSTLSLDHVSNILRSIGLKYAVLLIQIFDSFRLLWGKILLTSNTSALHTTYCLEFIKLQ